MALLYPPSPLLRLPYPTLSYSTLPYPAPPHPHIVVVFLFVFLMFCVVLFGLLSWSERALPEARGREVGVRARHSFASSPPPPP